VAKLFNPKTLRLVGKGGRADLQELIMRKCQNDPNFKRQNEFVKDWEAVSVFKLMDKQMTDAATGKPVTCKGWTYVPTSTGADQENAERVLNDAFNIDETNVHSGGRAYVVADATDEKMHMDDPMPSEELAEAARLARHPNIAQHLEKLEKTNPLAKKYLEGLFSVLAKYDDVIGKRFTGKRPERRLDVETPKRGRGRPRKNPVVVPKDEKKNKGGRPRKVVPDEPSKVEEPTPPTNTEVPF
jgi:hypothetical protein